MRGISHDTAAAHAAGITFAAEATAAVPGGHGSATNSAAVPAGSVGDEKAAASVVMLSPYSDRGTRWEPTREEQENMTRIFVHLLQPSTSLV